MEEDLARLRAAKDAWVRACSANLVLRTSLAWRSTSRACSLVCALQGCYVAVSWLSCGLKLGTLCTRLQAIS